MRLEKYFSVGSEILGLFVNNLTSVYEYYRGNTHKLPLPVQMELSENLGAFSAFFIRFLESALNFEHFEKKDERHGPSIPEVIPSEKRVYLHTQKVMFLKSLS